MQLNLNVRIYRISLCIRDGTYLHEISGSLKKLELAHALRKMKTVAEIRVLKSQSKKRQAQTERVENIRSKHAFFY